MALGICPIPQWLSGKEFTRSEGDVGSIPGSGRSSGEGHGHPLQYSCQKDPMDRGAWWAAVHGVTELDMTEWPSTYLNGLTQKILSFHPHKIPKDDADEVLHSFVSKFGKFSSGHRTGEGQYSFRSQRTAMPKNVQTTRQLCSFHMLVTLCLKSFKQASTVLELRPIKCTS